ncbi:MAG TPA: hypothetical protein VKX49_00330 [Bryobacteraceae bacterium]|nr:hypothetical protein [Bryobacteraceae bacterium]
MHDCRTLIAIWGPQEAHTNFINRLIESGWEGHAPNPTDDDGYLTACLRIMTAEGITDVGEIVQPYPPELIIKDEHGSRITSGSVLPGFAHENVRDQVAAQLDDFPGLEFPTADDTQAAIIADGEYPPFDWARSVIDRYYADGLRFCFLCYEPCEGPDSRLCVFYSASADVQGFKADGSVYCHALEQTSHTPEDRWPIMTGAHGKAEASCPTEPRGSSLTLLQTDSPTARHPA